MKLALRVLGVLLVFGAMTLIEAPLFAALNRHGYQLDPNNSVWRDVRFMTAFLAGLWLSESGPSLLRWVAKSGRLKINGKDWTDRPM